MCHSVNRQSVLTSRCPPPMVCRTRVLFCHVRLQITPPPPPPSTLPTPGFLGRRTLLSSFRCHDHVSLSASASFFLSSVCIRALSKFSNYGPLPSRGHCKSLTFGWLTFHEFPAVAVYHSFPLNWYSSPDEPHIFSSFVPIFVPLLPLFMSFSPRSSITPPPFFFSLPPCDFCTSV